MMIKLRLTYYTLTARKSVTFNMYPDIECITNPSGLFPIKGKEIIRAYKDRVAKGMSMVGSICWRRFNPLFFFGLDKVYILLVAYRVIRIQKYSNKPKGDEKKC